MCSKSDTPKFHAQNCTGLDSCPRNSRATSCFLWHLDSMPLSSRESGFFCHNSSEQISPWMTSLPRGSLIHRIHRLVSPYFWTNPNTIEELEVMHLVGHAFYMKISPQYPIMLAGVDDTSPCCSSNPSIHSPKNHTSPLKSFPTMAVSQEKSSP